MIFRDAMEFSESFFGKTPEAFQAIDIDFSTGEDFSMIHSEMTVSAKHQGIVSPEFVRVNDRSSADGFDSHVQQTFSGDIFHYMHLDDAVSLQDTENRDFPGRSSSSFTLTTTAEIAFIHFDLSSQKRITHPALVSKKNRQADDMAPLENGRIAEPDLLRYFPRRYFEFEEFDNPKPFLERNMEPVDPSIREVVKGVATPFTSIPFALNSVDPIAPTSTAKNMAFFPAIFLQEKTGLVLRFPYKFKGFQVHDTNIRSINSVSNLL